MGLIHPMRAAACDAAGLAGVVESLSGAEWVFWLLSAICAVVLAAISGLLVYLKKKRIF